MDGGMDEEVRAVARDATRGEIHGHGRLAGIKLGEALLLRNSIAVSPLGRVPHSSFHHSRISSTS